MLLAYDTDRRMQQEKLARAYTLSEWWVEAGPAYFDETETGVKAAAADATERIKARGAKAYSAEQK